MKKGERIQWGCGHWLVAGAFGLQDDYAKGVTAKRCGECIRRLHDAAPDLLAALEELVALARPKNGRRKRLHPALERAETAIAKARNNQTGQGIRPASNQ